MPNRTVFLIDKLVPLGLTDTIFIPLHHLGVTITNHRDHCMGVSSFNGPTNVDVRERLDYIYHHIDSRGFKDSLPPGLLAHLAAEALRLYPMREDDGEGAGFRPFQVIESAPANQADAGAVTDCLDAELLTPFMTGFFGYGNVQGDYWFIGGEESEGGTCAEVEGRIRSWNQRGRKMVEDLADFHEACGVKRWFSWRELNPIWSRLIRLLLSATGLPREDRDVLMYQVDKLGRSAGATCLMNLMPLPTQTVENWQYHAWSKLPSLHSKGTYMKALVPPRAVRLKQLLTENHPKLVVFYDSIYENLWPFLYPHGIKFERFQISGGHGWKIAHHDGSIYVLCAHPTTTDLPNNYFDAIGRKIRIIDRSLCLP